MGLKLNKPKAIATAEARCIKDKRSKQLQLHSPSFQCNVMPCMGMRKFKGMLEVCAQQETQRRQANFWYQTCAIEPCDNAMKPVGARPGKQVIRLVHRRSECALNDVHCTQGGRVATRSVVAAKDVITVQTLQQRHTQDGWCRACRIHTDSNLYTFQQSLARRTLQGKHAHRAFRSTWASHAMRSRGKTV
eukprot:6205177-Pleurochrysis_carterae.AAC.2